MVLGGELMNMYDHSQEVVVSTIWDFVPSDASAFAEAVPFWLDIGGCDSSEQPAMAAGEFSYASPENTTHFNGKVAAIGGHLHDGGTHLEILKNGKPICNTQAAYKGDHISQMSTCSDATPVAPGDRWSLSAHYDTSEHVPMANNDGSLEPVMGIALVYIAMTPLSTQTSIAWSIVAVILVGVFAATIGVVVSLYFRKHGSLWPKWKSDARGSWEQVAAEEPRDDEEDLELSPLLEPRQNGQFDHKWRESEGIMRL